MTNLLNTYLAEGFTKDSDLYKQLLEQTIALGTMLTHESSKIYNSIINPVNFTAQDNEKAAQEFQNKHSELINLLQINLYILTEIAGITLDTTPVSDLDKRMMHITPLNDVLVLMKGKVQYRIAGMNKYHSVDFGYYRTLGDFKNLLR